MVALRSALNGAPGVVGTRRTYLDIPAPRKVDPHYNVFAGRRKARQPADQPGEHAVATFDLRPARR